MPVWIKTNNCSCNAGNPDNACWNIPIITGPWFSFYIYQGAALSYAIQALNSPTSWAASGLPTGLSINTTTGEITGTAWATVGWYSSIVQAYNDCGSSAVITLRIHIISQPSDVSCGFTSITTSDTFGSSGVYCGSTGGCSTSRTYDVTGQFSANTTLRSSPSISDGKMGFRYRTNSTWWGDYFPSGSTAVLFLVPSGTTELEIVTFCTSDWASGSFTFSCVPPPP